jgi:hypothetical protein
MAAITNTLVSTAAVGNREELSDVVSRITPEDTPLFSMMRKTRATSTHPEWETDTLATPAANAQAEGDDYSSWTAVTAPSRVGNYTQIFRKDWIISNTQEAVDNAGRVEKRRYQRLKKGIELRKDIEFALVSNTASVASGTRYLGSLFSWLETNDSMGATGSDGGYNSGTGLTVAATPGTQRAFTKALFDTVLQGVYNSGGTPKRAVLSPYAKTVFTTFMSDSNVASFRYAASGSSNSIIATADVYEGDFGKTMVVPNRVMATSAAIAKQVFIVDPDLLEMKMLRPIQDLDIAATGDAEKGVIVAEGTLCVKNEAGLGVVADIFGLTAST